MRSDLPPPVQVKTSLMSRASSRQYLIPKKGLQRAAAVTVTSKRASRGHAQLPCMMELLCQVISNDLGLSICTNAAATLNSLNVVVVDGPLAVTQPSAHKLGFKSISRRTFKSLTAVTVSLLRSANRGHTQLTCMMELLCPVSWACP